MGSLVNVVLSLVGILIAIFVVAYFLKKTKTFSTLTSNLIQPVASLSLGNRERAVLIQVGDKQILVGVTNTAINTLHVFEEPVNLANHQEKSFKKIFSKASQKATV